MSEFLHSDDNAADVKATAIPRVFSENSRAENESRTSITNMTTFTVRCSMEMRLLPFFQSEEQLISMSFFYS